MRGLTGEGCDACPHELRLVNRQPEACPELIEVEGQEWSGGRAVHGQRAQSSADGRGFPRPSQGPGRQRVHTIEVQVHEPCIDL